MPFRYTILIRHVLAQPGVRKVEAGVPWAVGSATRAWNFCGVHNVTKVENLCLIVTCLTSEIGNVLSRRTHVTQLINNALNKCEFALGKRTPSSNTKRRPVWSQPCRWKQTRHAGRMFQVRTRKMIALLASRRSQLSLSAGSGAFRTPLLFSWLRRFVYLVRRGAAAGRSYYM